MRNRITILTAALLLASAPFAGAQQPPPPTQPTSPGAPEETTFGTIDLGFRGSDPTGDAARFQRYEDMQSGTFSRIVFDKGTETHFFKGSAYNIGYRDQRYTASFIGNGVRLTGGFTSVPLNYGFNTSTPWVEASPGVFTLDSPERQLVQNKAVVGVPQTAKDLLSTSVYRPIASPIDLQSLRQTGGVNFAFDATRDVGVDASFNSTRRSGSQPWGASFAFNVANELPLSLDNRTNDASAGLEFARERGMLRLGWTGSWFDNRIKSLVWDNPYRATDTSPYDPSGYSNGNGPAQGRMSMPPSNSLNTVSGMGLYKLAKHTTINGTVAFTQMNQNDTLIPWTINPVINSPAVLAQFPGLASLERSTAEAKVNNVNALVNFTTRPNRYVGFTARYRYNDRINKTPIFDAVEYVRFDAVPEETGGETEPFNITEQTFDANATFNLIKYTSLRVGYGYDGFQRTDRAYGTMADNIFRTSIDTVGNQYLTVRALYEFTARRGSQFDQTAITGGGAQPGLRFYDEAERDRHRGTLLFVVSPIESFDVTASVAAGKDTYNGAGQQFGLLDNDNTAYNVGVNIYPNGLPVTFGANYGRDHYASNQQSRNANPPPDPQFDDPTRNWKLNNTENVNNFDLYIDLPKVIRKTNVRVSYNYSDSDNGFTFGGPRIDALAAIGQFIPLPNVTNKWHRLMTDVQYFFVPKVGIGLGYWYEKFDVNDFATVDLTPGTPRIDYLGEISTGYGNRPYRGNTAFVRLLYLF